MSPDHDDDVELGPRGSLPAEDGEGGGGPARGGGKRPAAARLVGVGHVVVGADLGVGHHARVWKEKDATCQIIPGEISGCFPGFVDTKAKVAMQDNEHVLCFEVN